MGRIADVLKFFPGTRRNAIVTAVVCDTGGGYFVTGQNFSVSGEDSPPLTGDYALLVDTPGTGDIAVAGYVDPINVKVALAGERRLYARSTDGVIVATVHLKQTGEATVFNSKVSATINPDGSATLTNGAGTMTLLDNGDFNINGVVIKPDGSIIVPKSVSSPLIQVDGKELKDHTHSGVDAGADDSGPNN